MTVLAIWGGLVLGLALLAGLYLWVESQLKPPFEAPSLRDQVEQAEQQIQVVPDLPDDPLATQQIAKAAVRIINEQAQQTAEQQVVVSDSPTGPSPRQRVARPRSSRTGRFVARTDRDPDGN